MVLANERSSLKELALQVLRGCGVFSLARALSARKGRVLMYHNFSGAGETEPDALNVDGARRQFEYLRRRFRVVPLLEIAGRLVAGKGFDKQTVAITIDDGRRNCYEFLFPLLKEFGLPATFFVVSSFVRGEDWIWTDKVLWLSEQSRRPEELVPGKLEPVFKSLNCMRPEVRNARIDAMAASAEISIPQQPPPKYAPCSWSELREMADSGLMDIGSQTVTHPILSSVTDEESWWELTESRRQLEEATGRTVRSFCFPNGMPGDYRPSQVRQLVDAGYACSVVAHFGLVSSGANPYLLPRIGMALKSRPVEFSKYLDGAAYYQQKLQTLFRAHDAE